MILLLICSLFKHTFVKAWHWTTLTFLAWLPLSVSERLKSFKVVGKFSQYSAWVLSSCCGNEQSNEFQSSGGRWYSPDRPLHRNLLWNTWWTITFVQNFCPLIKWWWRLNRGLAFIYCTDSCISSASVSLRCVFITTECHWWLYIHEGKRKCQLSALLWSWRLLSLHSSQPQRDTKHQ